MNKLGIYFGSRLISIAELKGRQLLNNIEITLPAIASDTGGIAPSDEAQIVTLIKEQLVKKKIEVKEAAVALSGKDFIIRNFEMGLLPREELANAVNFEVRKYIPFKTEELIADFQYKLDRTAQKNRILFVAIKKEILDRYLSIINKLGLKITALEYSAFSILRLLKLGNVGGQKGIKGIFSADLVESDEINFVVLENGFPLFSRDVVLIGSNAPGEEAKAAVEEPAAILEKLKREIRISMDYYDRTLPLKSIDKMLFVMDRNYQAELEGFFTFIRDIGLALQFVDLKRCLGRSLPFSLAFLKSYTVALSNINTGLRPDLLKAREKTVKKVVAVPQTKAGVFLAQLKSEYSKALMVAIVICLAVYYFGISRLAPLEKELKKITAVRPSLATIKANANYDQLVSINVDYRNKITALDELLKRKVYVTELLDIIPRVTPSSMRFSELVLNNEDKKRELLLCGIVYLGDTNQEMDAVNSFVKALKANPAFTRHFKEISVVSINHEQVFGKATTVFVINCKK